MKIHRSSLNFRDLLGETAARCTPAAITERQRDGRRYRESMRTAVRENTSATAESERSTTPSPHSLRILRTATGTIMRYRPAMTPAIFSSGEVRPGWCGNAEIPPRPGGRGGISGVCVRRCPTLPHPVECSTIGAGGLSFRVRNGTGRFPSAMAAVTL
mgnify:FL=1